MLKLVARKLIFRVFRNQFPASEAPDYFFNGLLGIAAAFMRVSNL
jgi:hypothetical protein